MKTNQTQKQIAYLFLSSLSILFTGMGLFPLLPVYAAEFGANAGQTGLYLALTYISITAGTLISGWLSSRVHPRLLFGAAGLAGIPALLLMAQARELWQVVALTMLIWFVGGTGLSLSAVYTGLLASAKSRGTSFSLQALAQPIGAIFGGLAIGAILKDYGYPQVFGLLALVWTVWPLLAFTLIRYPEVTRREARSSPAPAPRFAGLPLLLAAVLLPSLTVSASRLGLSLEMKALQFSPSEISSTSFVGGLASIPLVLLAGGLADRLGRKRLLDAAYLVTAGSALILTVSGSLWSYYLASTLSLVALCLNQSVASALAADLLPPGGLSRVLPSISAMRWIAGIAGFGATGVLLEALGGPVLFAAVALLPLAAIGLLELLSGAPAQPVTSSRPAEAHSGTD